MLQGSNLMVSSGREAFGILENAQKLTATGRA